MKKIIHELEQKQSDYQNMKKYIANLEDQLRAKDQQLLRKNREYENIIREKDGRIRDLDHAINMNNTKISQLESQIRVTGEDKNNKNR